MEGKARGIILKQLRSLGASCDWQRTTQTLDPHYSKAVLTAFFKLYKDGFIYRGRRMCNWCPSSLTAPFGRGGHHEAPEKLPLHYSLRDSRGTGQIYPSLHHPPGNHHG